MEGQTPSIEVATPRSKGSPTPLLENPGQSTREFVLLGTWEPWVIWLIAGLTVFIFAMSVYNYRHLTPLRRRLGLLFLRAAGLALLLGMFIQPAVVEETQARSRNQVAILLDTSQSMSLPHGPSTRFDMAQDFLRNNASLLTSLAQDNDLLLFALGEDLKPLAPLNDEENAWKSLVPNAPGTRLVHGLAQLKRHLHNRDLGAVIVLTDGVDTDRPDGLEEADRMALEDLRAPVFFFSTQGASPVRDVAIRRLATNSFAFYMNTTSVEAEVEVLGLTSGSIALTFSENGREISRRYLPVEAGKTDYQVSFEFVPKTLGKQVLEVKAEAIEGEIYLPNNRRQAVIQVVRDKVRVLQIVGQPSWDERFLRNHLKSDPNVDLISFFILVNPQNYRPVNTRDTALIPFPARELFEEELGGFDLVIFQNFNYGPFQTRRYLPKIAQFVREGGAFLMIGGPRSFASGGYRGTPITDILPVELPSDRPRTRRSGGPSKDPLVDTSTFKGHLTTVGQSHPVMRLTPQVSANRGVWEGLEALEGFNKVQGIKKDALVLLEHPTQRLPNGSKAPLVVLGPAGKGRAMAVLTDSTWHWSFHAGNRGGDRQHYDEFWASSLRWLVGDPELALVHVRLRDERVRVGSATVVSVEVNQANYQPAVGAQVHLTLSREGDDAPAFEAEELVTNAEGRVDVEIPVNALGVYRLKAFATHQGTPIGHGTNVLVATQRSREFERLQTEGDLVEAIAKATGGEVFPITARPLTLPTREARVIKVTRRQSHELWTEPWVLLAILLLFSAEWALRRRYGYV